MVLPIQIIQQIDPNTANLVIATWGIALATIIGIGITTYYTRRSLIETRKNNQLLTLELKAKYKPKLTFPIGHLGYEPNNTKRVTFTMQMFNSGIVPIRNTAISHMTSTTKITPQMLIDNELTIKKTKNSISGTLDPERYHYRKIPLNVDTTKDLWVAIWIEYEYLETIKEECIALFYFLPRLDTTVNAVGSMDFIWYGHDDIIHARNDKTESSA